MLSINALLLGTASAQEENAKEQDCQHQGGYNDIFAILFQGKGHDRYRNPYNRGGNQHQQAQCDDGLWAQYEQSRSDLAERLGKIEQTVKRQSSRSRG